MIATSVRTAKKMRACLVKSTRSGAGCILMLLPLKESMLQILLRAKSTSAVYSLARNVFALWTTSFIDTQYVTGVGHPLEARWGRSPEARDSYFNLYSIPEKATEGRLKKKYL
ncbi:uncharacterized protein LOC111260734 isoform X3 [Varroa jacobsoni]|uniref:uncharacterized protein LOC111260734 isoform X3 n=1 Tax=Varroa jacobsoni TaxID=62625 RepID=UPI000BF3079A|nr:uncharacterized protein LOC111260734 isoform X3 [Varroa jacobsoni]